MEGIIKWFNMQRGFGFITSEGKDYFVHRRDIEAKSKLKRGDIVSFDLSLNKPGKEQKR